MAELKGFQLKIMNMSFSLTEYERDGILSQQIRCLQGSRFDEFIRDIRIFDAGDSVWIQGTIVRAFLTPIYICEVLHIYDKNGQELTFSDDNTDRRVAISKYTSPNDETSAISCRV